VRFRHIAGEIVLPPDKLVSENVVPEADDEGASGEVAGQPVGRQFARSPFVASFRSNWLGFDICTVHIYYGEEHGEKLRRRIAEIREIAEYLGGRAVDAQDAGTSLILLGDFNVVDPEHETMDALLASGFKTASTLENIASNIGRDKYYDQIVFHTRPGVLEYTETRPRRASPGPASSRSSATSSPRPSSTTINRRPGQPPPATTRPGTSYATTTSTGARTSSPTTCRCGSSCASMTAPPTSSASSAGDDQQLRLTSEPGPPPVHGTRRNRRR
jgi:hypothetical protein